MSFPSALLGAGSAARLRSWCRLLLISLVALRRVDRRRLSGWSWILSWSAYAALKRRSSTVLPAFVFTARLKSWPSRSVALERDSRFLAGLAPGSEW